MGYACPVCETPQRDGEHLANHLAFTAMLDDDAHEAWLDEHAPGWAEATPADLAARVTDHAPETEYQEVFEDTVHEHGDHEETLFDEEAAAPEVDAASAGRRGGGDLDAEAQQILQEARSMTEEMLEDDEADEGKES